MALSAETKLSARLRARGFWSYARLLGDFDSPYGPSSNDTIRHNARGLMDVLLAPRWSATAGTELLFERGESSFVTNRNGDMLPIRRRVVGTFVETRGDLGNRASITAGLRVEHIQRASLEADAFGQRPALDTASHVSLNPRLGASWLAYRSGSGGSSTRVRASAGTGIRPPDVFELAFTDNPDLAAERSRSYEAGAEQTLAGGRLVAEVTWFSNEYDDLIVAVAPAFQDASRYLTDNIANARARGLEVSGSLRPGRHVTIRSAYTWLDTEILAVDGRSGAAPAPFTAGDPLIRRPRHQGWLEVISTTERIETFARFGARGRVLDIDPSFGAFGGRLRGPGYAVLDAGASVTLFKGLSLFGRMTNALDRSYEEALGFPSPGRLLMGGVRVAARR